MTSKSSLTYGERAKAHENPLVKKLFEIAETKQTNIIISADLTTTKELLDFADKLGPYIAVFKTHIDIVSDFSNETIRGLKRLSNKHNFLLFEDRKFVDIGHTVQKQYHRGALRISEWAHIVNACILPGDGIVEALSQSGKEAENEYSEYRGLLLLAEMTSKGSLAIGEFTQKSIATARRYAPFVIGFVAQRALGESSRFDVEDEDFVIFTTGVNRAIEGDSLGQRYQTIANAIGGGSDFIIVGRGIYAATDPVSMVSLYRSEAWRAYAGRVGTSLESPGAQHLNP